ncbi:lysophospholipase [Exilibacterium tricleocarpae]|uniref:Lysophospholipase n=1 Tax=Exilibacterium tricleocarpae TaxID=2591008 RepID=A0A545TLR8_9GAMM|nr:alpha/beta fold hydrolase [Exilibacterium tricleocarpae]TQV78187.1 lysophospholipase [Exilibacterium tricleocarpae]
MRKSALFIAICLIGGTIATIVVAEIIAAPQQRIVGPPPDNLPAESVFIEREQASPVAGWFIAGRPNHPGILLLHGIRADRRSMLGRAYFLYEAGYSVLLIDMQAHGETPGSYITFGYRESYDVHAALRYLRARLPDQPLGIVGVSLGGAAVLLGEKPVNADALVLEAVYSALDQAVQNRLTIRLGEVGRLLAPLLLWQVEPRLGIAVESLSPVSSISALTAPIMIVAGTEDKRTRPDETEKLFSLAPEPKQLYWVQGARHEDLHQYQPQEYEHKVLAFFDKYLRPTVDE